LIKRIDSFFKIYKVCWRQIGDDLS